MSDQNLYFEELFNLHYQGLCNYANLYIGDKEAIEDIVQSFFICLWETGVLNSLQKEEFLPYAHRAVKNRCINYFKHEIVHQGFLTRLADEWSDSLEWNEKEEFIYKAEVRAALQKMPKKCRKVFLLKCMSDMKYKEIAEVTGISVNTVKYHLTEAFRIMRKELGHLFYIFICFFFY